MESCFIRLLPTEKIPQFAPCGYSPIYWLILVPFSPFLKSTLDPGAPNASHRRGVDATGLMGSSFGNQSKEQWSKVLNFRCMLEICSIGWQILTQVRRQWPPLISFLLLTKESSTNLTNFYDDPWREINCHNKIDHHRAENKMHYSFLTNPIH